MDVATAVRKKMMDLLAARPHSEHELRQKLIARFDQVPDAEEAIDAALQHGREHRWIPEAEDLAEQTVMALRKKGKGTEFINQYLEEKGLPTIPLDSELELEKAQELVKNKFRAGQDFSDEDKMRAARFLASRGFDEEIVRKVIYEKF